jgi:hypothetical protein
MMMTRYDYVPPPGSGEAVDVPTPALDHTVIDCTSQVEADAEVIRMLRQRAPAVAFVNNHFARDAPETARQLIARMGPDASA